MHDKGQYAGSRSVIKILVSNLGYRIVCSLMISMQVTFQYADYSSVYGLQLSLHDVDYHKNGICRSEESMSARD